MATDVPVAFFSYSRDDSEFALRLAEDLKASGASVWIDQLDIEPGQEWDSAIEDAVTRSPRMLLILSPASVQSRNVRNEIAFALDERKTIIPVLCHDCTVPLNLRRIHYIDFRSEYEGALKALLKVLRVEQPMQPPAPAICMLSRKGPECGRQRNPHGNRRRTEPPKKVVLSKAEKRPGLPGSCSHSLG